MACVIVHWESLDDADASMESFMSASAAQGFPSWRRYLNNEDAALRKLAVIN